MGMSTGGGGGFKADINVTPLVDVCLVLLIIFMVVTPMLKQGVAVQLPETKNGKQFEEDKKDNIVCAIKDDGTIYVEGVQVPGAEADTPEGNDALESSIRSALQAGKTKPLLIKADARLKYGQVKRVMELVKKKIPLRSVKIAADKAKKGAAPAAG
jgi:biopolymer transport protein TolR